MVPTRGTVRGTLHVLLRPLSVWKHSGDVHWWLCEWLLVSAPWWTGDLGVPSSLSSRQWWIMDGELFTPGMYIQGPGLTGSFKDLECLGIWKKWQAGLNLRELKWDFVETDKGFFYLYGQGPFPLPLSLLSSLSHSLPSFLFSGSLYLSSPPSLTSLCHPSLASPFTRSLSLLAELPPCWLPLFRFWQGNWHCVCLIHRSCVCERVCVLARGPAVAVTSKPKPVSPQSAVSL